jgi:UDPglucose 6-dehydrogenase
LNAGIGFGGYCLPKDLKALVHLAGEHGVNLALLKEVERINRGRIELFLKKIGEAVWIVQGKTIAVLGAAFKPDTDDIREAPSVPIVEALQREGAILRIYDPKAMPGFSKLFPEQAGRLSYCDSAYDAAKGAHAVLLLTEWEQFRNLDLKLLQEEMEVPVIVDGRNFFDPDLVRGAGFEYHCMGRASLRHAGEPAAKETVSVQNASGNIGDWRSWVSPFPSKRSVHRGGA